MTLPPGFEHVRCDACGAQESREAFRTRDHLHGGADEFTVVECASCGHWYLDPVPTPEKLGDYYPSDYGAYAFASPMVRIANELFVLKRGHQIQRHAAPGARLLDVGCGDGRLLESLARRGYQVQGVEFKDSAARACRETKGLDVVGGTLEDARFPPDHFDVVTLFHVLEHLRNPSRTLKEIWRILRPGGTLLLEVPNRASRISKLMGPYWAGWHLPRHFHHFTPPILGSLLGRAGFVGTEVRDVIADVYYGSSFAQCVGDWIAPDRPVPRAVLLLRPFVKLIVLPIGYLLTTIGILDTGVMLVAAQKPEDCGTLGGR